MKTLFIISPKTIRYLMDVEIKLDYKKNQRTLDQINELIKEYLISLGFHKDDLINNTMVMDVDRFVEPLNIGEFIDINSTKWKVEDKQQESNRTIYYLELIQNIKQPFDNKYKKLDLSKKKEPHFSEELKVLFKEITDPLIKMYMTKEVALQKLKKGETNDGELAGDASFETYDEGQYKIEIELKFKITKL